MNTTIDLDLLARDLEVAGIAPHEHRLARVVGTARAAAVRPVLLDVLGDRGAPPAARLRAFGLVARDLSRVGGAPAVPVRSAA